jgi:hypothetical protein
MFWSKFANLVKTVHPASTERQKCAGEEYNETN